MNTDSKFSVTLLRTENKRVRLFFKDSKKLIGYGEGVTLAAAMRDLAAFVEKHPDDFGAWQPRKGGSK